jgi:prepilin-type processing-associated H-X9-DG protein
MMSISRHPAYTLIETLVAVAIGGILVGLLMCAVQQVRAAAYRTQCQNNLRQIALSLHNYHDVNKTFPPGCRGFSDPQPFMSWMTRLLPFLEMDALWQDAQQAYVTDKFFIKKPHWPILSRPMPVFVCPADGRLVSEISRLTVAHTSYLGVDGRDMNVFDGVLFLDSSVRISEVSDGASNTLIVGERPPSRDGRLGWWYAGWGQGQSGTGDLFLGVRERDLEYRSCSLEPNHFARGSSGDCDAFHFWSFHSGGAHFVFCDGSVRFLSYDSDSILPSLSTRAGGELVNLP